MQRAVVASNDPGVRSRIALIHSAAAASCKREANVVDSTAFPRSSRFRWNESGPNFGTFIDRLDPAPDLLTFVSAEMNRD
jgi:hypothetical protein